MEIGITILNQIIKMFLLMSVGYYIYKKEWVSEDGTQQISNILLKVCTPALMITSFNILFSYETLIQIFVSFVLSSVSIIIGLIVARIIYKDKNRVGQFAIAFSNSGFIGIPLVQSLMGDKYIIYLSAFILAFNLFGWTIGVYLVSGRKDLITPKLILKSPAVIGLGLGMLVFISPIKLPELLHSPIAMIGNLNTPLAMIVLGTYIAKNNISEVFKSIDAYKISFIRLIIVPIITALVLYFVPETFYDIKKVVLIATSAPVAVMVAMLSQQYGGDFEYGARIVSLSTILCLFTIPVVLLIGEFIW
ncbi:MAG: AEC family transporter [Erysipelotrichaceae bacterium]|nr:AEC family transporter [Erysipelotrichaceae bacterium]